MITTGSITPAVTGWRRRSRYSETCDARVIFDVAFAARGVPFPLPVVHGGKHLGWAWGAPDGACSFFAPPGVVLSPFATYDQLIKALSASRHFTFQWSKTYLGVVSNWYDYWACRGVPAAGTYGGTARTARQFDDTSIGAMQHGGNVSPSEKFVTRFTAHATTVPRTFILYDRVLAYDACTLTAGNQTMTNALTAQRYATTSLGLQMMMVADTALNATTANLTQLRYSNSQGVTLQSMPTSPTVQHIVSAAAPTATQPSRVIAPGVSSTAVNQPFLPLAAGDTGVRLVNDYTWSAAPTGTFCLALVFPLAYLSGVGANAQASDIDLLQGIYGNQKITRIFDGACLSVMGLTGAAAECLTQGNVEVTWTS